MSVGHHDVAIVGAGPIGLELAVVLAEMGVDTVHFDAGQIGQTITWYPRQVRYFSSPERIAIAGVPLETVGQEKASREEYLAYLRGVVEQFALKIHTFERVERIARDADSGTFTLHTTRAGESHEYTAEHVVLAIGDMHRPRRLNVPGEDLPHVSHYFDEPHRYFRQRLLIVGGKNSAAEAAIRCHRVGAKVAISYRRAEFSERSIKYWLLPELRSLIRAGLIDFHPKTVPVEITRQHVRLAEVGDDGQVLGAKDDAPGLREVPADFVLLLTGYEMDATLLEQAGVELQGHNRAPTLDRETMMTNVPNLYVAGTAAAGTQHHYRLFIENCHNHVTRVARAITGREPPARLINQVASQYELPES